MFSSQAIPRDCRSRANEAHRASAKRPADCVRVSTRSRRLARGLVAVAAAVALPAAFVTSPAAAAPTTMAAEVMVVDPGMGPTCVQVVGWKNGEPILMLVPCPATN
jgi:hypothetical protein